MPGSSGQGMRRCRRRMLERLLSAAGSADDGDGSPASMRATSASVSLSSERSVAS